MAGRILVTGATGFIGMELARHLSSEGLRPRLLIRRPDRAVLLRDLDAEIIPGDLEDLASLERAVRGVDTVIHLGGRALFENYKLVQGTLVHGSVALMRASQEAGVSSFVFASSLLVYASSPNLIDATTPLEPLGGYGRAKAEAEDLLTKLADKSGLRLAILRLPHVYGPTSLLFDQIRSGWMLQPGSGANIYSHMHVHDAARLLTAVADSSWSGASPVADASPQRWVDFFGRCRSLYPRFHYLRLPSWLALSGAFLAESLSAARRRPAMLTTDAVRGFNLNLAVRPGLVWDELGLEMRFPTIQEGLADVFCRGVPFAWQPSVRDHCACFLDAGSCPAEFKI